jgi:hypothetical protein
MAEDIQFKRPVFSERYVYCFGFFLDGIHPRKYPTTCVLACVAVGVLSVGAHLVQ